MDKAHWDVVQEGIGVFQSTNKTRHSKYTDENVNKARCYAITHLHSYYWIWLKNIRFEVYFPCVSV